MPFQIIRNDITKVKADAIVNTANPLVTIGTGVDSAIYEAAGKEELLKARQELGELQEGEVGITPAFRLPARYILHACGPKWRGGGQGEAEILRRCYDRALRLAARYQCRSIAFPLMATGNYAFPKELGLQIAIDSFQDFLEEQEMEITLVVFTDYAYKVSGDIFQSVERFVDSRYVKSALAKEHQGDDSLRDTDLALDEDRNEGQSASFFGLPSASGRTKRSKIADKMMGAFAAVPREALARPSEEPMPEALARSPEEPMPKALARPSEEPVPEALARSSEEPMPKVLAKMQEEDQEELFGDEFAEPSENCFEDELAELPEEALEEAPEELFEDALERSAKEAPEELFEDFVAESPKEPLPEVSEKAFEDFVAESPKEPIPEVSEKVFEDFVAESPKEPMPEVSEKPFEDFVAESPKEPIPEVSEKVFEDVVAESSEQVSGRENFIKKSLDHVLKKIYRESFEKHLQQMINKKGLKNSEVYAAANISKQYFSKLLKGQVKPSKEKVLALAVGLKLNLDETIDLLRMAGYALSPISQTDAVVEYFIEKKEYNVMKIDIVLFDYGLDPLSKG